MLPEEDWLASSGCRRFREGGRMTICRVMMKKITELNWKKSVPRLGGLSGSFDECENWVFLFTNRKRWAWISPERKRKRPSAWEQKSKFRIPIQFLDSLNPLFLIKILECPKLQADSNPSWKIQMETLEKKQTLPRKIELRLGDGTELVLPERWVLSGGGSNSPGRADDKRQRKSGREGSSI